ncbi:MAG: bifunctional acetate--CoA ligase family protein/GNAT family N-acetyltransferase [Deltaproteobacteria bacterium]|nr:bifunctional acetate--CoA ligase family protein/GNAT family N-acetyltransferase [Deltaproteobacteria bacterium]
MERRDLDNLFNPEAVAVIGASEKDPSIGRSLVQNLQKAGFPGTIYPINPRYSQILGLQAFSSVLKVQAPIDLAVIAIPIQDVPRVMQECGEAGVRTAVIISAGGRETGAEGEKIEAAIHQEALKWGIRYLGPNCWGVICPLSRLHATFAPHFPRPGSLAFISQSGALCSSIIGWAALKNIGFSHFLSLGSKADLDFADLIDYLGNDDKTRSIIIYMEKLTRHRKFMSAARSVSRVKPIIVIKAGRTWAGARGVTPSGGIWQGKDTAYTAAFRRAGIIRVDTFGQLFDCAEALEKVQRPLGNNLGIITNAGGPGVMAVDTLTRWQVKPGVLAPETLEKVREILPPYRIPGNPINLLGDATPERYARAVQIGMEAPELSGLVIILSPQALTDSTGVAQAVVAAVQGQARPVFAVWMGGEDVTAGTRILNEAGIPTFETPEPAVETFLEMYSYSRNLELLQQTPPRLPKEFQVNTPQARAFIEQRLEGRARILTPLESKAILSAYGIPINPTLAAASRTEAARAARDIGFPVVLKIHSPDFNPKTMEGGARFYLRTEKEVEAAFDQIVGEVAMGHPEANILGVTVESQEREPDCQLFIGSKRDPDFGPLILFGLGGAFTEIMEDYAIDLPPLNVHLAQSLMKRTRIFRVLQGYRHLPASNLDLLVELLVRISQLVTDFPEIVELDINPLLLIGNRVVAVDARITVEPSTVAAPRHLIISPYPNQYESHWLLRDGTPILLRPMKPEDEPLVFDFLNKCSDETIYFRYFRLIKNWTHEMLIRFTQNDYDREMGLMAIAQPPSPEVMLGVTRLVMDADRQKGEFAVIVGDPWQGKGLGPKLLEQLIAVARDQGLQLLYGDVLAQNKPMLEMAKKAGFHLKRMAEGVVRIELKL